ncbi:hypothetical protein [Brevibacillus fortis]|uniref:hypothetical protein n=1 Tax=Brevibacillus fortis TaxID=2126352 RepID=UPI001FC99741|nr:hypothetical protein [Brevibacillus fortis]
MRDRPSNKGLQAFGATEVDQEIEGIKQNPFRAAIDGLVRGFRSFDFWLLAGSFFICGLSTNGLIGTHFIAAGENFREHVEVNISIERKNTRVDTRSLGC